MRPRMSLLLLAFASVFLAVAAVAAGARETPSLVRGQESSNCTSAATKIVVREFVRDFARGRVAAIGRLWAPAPRFQWYSTGPPGSRLGGPAYDRTTLVSYFRRRVRAHEKLRLVQIGARYDRTRRIVNFAGKLVRSADDMAPRAQEFKGAADCLSWRPLLIVWSM